MLAEGFYVGGGIIGLLILVLVILLIVWLIRRV